MEIINEYRNNCTQLARNNNLQKAGNVNDKAAGLHMIVMRDLWLSVWKQNRCSAAAGLGPCQRSSKHESISAVRLINNRWPPNSQECFMAQTSMWSLGDH